MTKLVLLFPFAVLAGGADGGCFGDSREAKPIDGGVEPLEVSARTARPGPHPARSLVDLEADVSGGVPPYLFRWQSPAFTIDESKGSGKIAVEDMNVLATVAVTDSTGSVASDSVLVEVEGDALSFTVEVRGPGRVGVGSFGICSAPECVYEVEAGAEIALLALPHGDARFEAWSGCSSSTSRSIAIRVARSGVVCTAHFALGTSMLPPCDAMPAPPGPIADVVVRPTLTDPPFAKNADGVYVVPRDVQIFIDGLGSRPRAGFGLDFDWSVSFDPFHQVPENPVAFFAIQSPGMPAQRVDVQLTVTDDCGRTATATAAYTTD